MHTIRFCENNFGYGTDQILEILEEECEDIKIEVYSCMGFCDDCAVSPYALVDGDIVQADTPDDLFEIIKSYIE
ncbi:DUF1450 domain-containing protein [Brassicibacter mesophilus]|uniref:DUF1450 domain-containing protein n=1 Tax=Brassicibacter mesophilus TaxID=745119 RepID=UPI003D1BBE08